LLYVQPASFSRVGTFTAFTECCGGLVLPINHVANRQNAIKFDPFRGSLVATLNGLTSGLPIYEIPIMSLVASELGGDNLVKLIQSMEKDNLRDLKKRGPGQPFAALTRQPTDHQDAAGNLPVGPPPFGYREYNVPANKLTMPGYLRLVADITYKRLYITPTHYDTWFDSPTAATAQDVNTAGGNRSPFFLLRSVRIYNDLFD
jgi:hypothetical protein